MKAVVVWGFPWHEEDVGMWAARERLLPGEWDEAGSIEEAKSILTRSGCLKHRVEHLSEGFDVVRAD